MSAPAEAEAASRLLALVNMASLSMAVSVAAELRLADLLAAGARDADSLAQETGVTADALRRLLGALASLGLCEQRAEGRFALRAEGRLLCAEHPRSLRAWMLWWGGYMWPLWEKLGQSVRTGKSARELATGKAGFRHVEGDARAAAVFNRAMSEFTQRVADEVVSRYDLSRFRRIVDIGGGHGTLLAVLLSAAPAARGVLVDLPHAIAGARATMKQAGLDDRCECLAGDFFRSVPEGGDLYLLKAVLHDWDDERAVLILANCRRAMAPRGTIAIVERVMPEVLASSPRDCALARADLNMLVAHGSRERTLADFCKLLERAGIALSRRIDTALEYSILEAAAA